MPVPRVMQTSVLGAAIVAELIVLVGHPLFGWGPTRRRPPVTPAALTLAPAAPPSAISVLRDLARTTARYAADPATPPTRGRYAYVQLRTWTLSDQLAASRDVDHPLVRTVTTWRARSAPGRAVVVVPTRRGARSTVTTLPASGPSPRLPAGVSTAQALRQFAALAAREPIPPATEARILAALAGDSGLVDAGVGVDRAGRAALGISFTGPAGGTEVRDLLLLDPRTGALLEFDETLAGDPGRLPVASGSVLATTLYVSAGRVSAIGSIPVTPAPR